MAVSDYLQLAMPAINFGKGILGIGENALITDAMREQLVQRAKETELNKGSLGYEAFGLPTSSKGGRFSGGLFDLALKDPVAFANVGSVGRVSFEKDPTQPGGYRFGDIKYDFTPDKNTGSTGNKILDFINEGGLAKKIADSNLSKTLSNLVFTPAGAAEVQNKNPFNNMISDTVLAEPRSQFQDYPGVENLGGVQNFDLEGVQDIISRMEEEKGNYIERPENRFSMDGIMENLGNYAKDAAGRYIGSKALSGAGLMLLGPIGGLVGGIAGLLGGGNLFNQNTYSQQMYNNLTPEGKAYASSLYGPGGPLQGYNQFHAGRRGTLGTIGNILSKNPNMSLARQNIFRTAADRYISGIDPIQQGINAVTKKGTHAYDDAAIKYAPPSGGGDSGGSGGGWSGGSGDNWGSGFDSSQATL